MPLGDFISREDYDQLYGKETRKSRAWSWFTVLCYVLCLILAAWITQGCDGQAAEATQESIVDAQMKKQALLEQPCTWVAQCMRIEMECPVKARRCVKGNKL